MGVFHSTLCIHYFCQVLAVHGGKPVSLTVLTVDNVR